MTDKISLEVENSRLRKELAATQRREAALRGAGITCEEAIHRAVTEGMSTTDSPLIDANVELRYALNYDGHNGGGNEL